MALLQKGLRQPISDLFLRFGHASLEGEYIVEQEIRSRFDDPDMYGDWFSLDKTEVAYKSADSLGKHFLREFERFWD